MNKSRVTSLRTALDETGASRGSYLGYCQAVCTVILHNDRVVRENAEWAFAKSPKLRKRYVYVDTNSEDETTLTIGMLNSLGLPSAFVESVGASASTYMVQHGTLPNWTPQKRNSKTQARIIQSANTYSMMAERDGDGKMISHSGTQANAVQLTDRTTGECYMQGERIRNGMSAFVGNDFEFLMRTCCYDGASSLWRNERQWGRGHPQFQTTWHFVRPTSVRERLEVELLDDCKGRHRRERKLYESCQPWHTLRQIR